MAIKAFGSELLTSNDVNTYLNYGGLVYINTFTLSGSPYQCTGVFSSTYDQYVIVASIYGSANSYCTLQYLVGASPDTSASYSKRGWYQSGTTLGAYSGTGETSHFFCQYGSTVGNSGYTVATCFNPNKTTRTGINIRNVDMLSADTYDISGQQTTTSQFTGFQLTATSGTLAGTVTVYGVRKA